MSKWNFIWCFTYSLSIRISLGKLCLGQNSQTGHSLMIRMYTSTQMSIQWFSMLVLFLGLGYHVAMTTQQLFSGKLSPRHIIEHVIERWTDTDRRADRKTEGRTGLWTDQSTKHLTYLYYAKNDDSLKSYRWYHFLYLSKKKKKN